MPFCFRCISVNDSFAVLMGFFKVRILKTISRYFILLICVIKFKEFHINIKSVIFTYFVKPVKMNGLHSTFEHTGFDCLKAVWAKFTT